MLRWAWRGVSADPSWEVMLRKDLVPWGTGTTEQTSSAAARLHRFPVKTKKRSHPSGQELFEPTQAAP